MSWRDRFMRAGRDANAQKAGQQADAAARFGRRKSGLITPLSRDQDGPSDSDVAEAKRVLRARLGRDLTQAEADLCRYLGRAPNRRERRTGANVGRRGRPEVLAARGALMPDARRRLLATARERRNLRLDQ